MTSRNFSNWRRRADAALRACEALGGDSSPLVISRPATEKEVLGVEQVLGFVLPTSFREVVTQFASKFELTWFLPDSPEPPFKGIFSGSISWDLESLPQLEAVRRDWVEKCFKNSSDPYDRVWHGKLAIQEVGNGDQLALDLEHPKAPLTYLSHDDGSGHGKVLGNDFADAIDRWIQLGGVGAENWQWLHFHRPDGLDPRGPDAHRWRAWFGNDA